MRPGQTATTRGSVAHRAAGIVPGILLLAFLDPLATLGGGVGRAGRSAGDGIRGFLNDMGR